MNSAGTIIVKANRLKAGLALAGSILFVALGAWMVLEQERVLYMTVGVLSIVFFGFCAVIFAATIVSNIAVIFSPTGIHSKMTFPRGMIEWSNIRAISIGSTWMKFDLIDAETYIRRLGRFSRIIAWINYYIFGSPVFISMNILDINAEKMTQILDEMPTPLRRK